jgi:hypothetical protein
MVLVDKKVVFCEAGQFLTVEGQAMTVYTSVMYLVRVTGPSDGGLETMAGRPCVLTAAGRVGTATTTDTSVVVGWR